MNPKKKKKINENLPEQLSTNEIFRASSLLTLSILFDVFALFELYDSLIGLKKRINQFEIVDDDVEIKPSSTSDGNRLKYVSEFVSFVSFSSIKNIKNLRKNIKLKKKENYK